jgi:putative transcriptional regulator
MTAITHHIPDAMLAAYAAGNLSHPFAVVVASHASFCEHCRVSLEAHQALGGVVIEATDAVDISNDLKSDILSQLDTSFTPIPVYDRSGIFPGPVVEALKGQQPRWKNLGMGVRQHILVDNDEGSLRLLHIPPEKAMPEHSHNGLELTLILQGSFSDKVGSFGVGDVEIGDEDLAHTPIADAGAPCICLAATDAPLRFNALIPRLLQPLFRI